MPAPDNTKAGFEAVIGLEVHCQLATESKVFSSDSARFVDEPNSHVDPLTLGHPGTLPVMNERAVEFAVRMGLATEATVHSPSVMARKHYFYPDLPKGYQISQYDRPICTGGFVEIPGGPEEAEPRRIRLTRIHLEEDAGKSIHVEGESHSLLDYNRSGVPLIEIVTEPDIRTPREAYDTMRKIRRIVRYLEICDGNMEEGSLRCDANVSVRPTGARELGRKTEIKNLNSFRFLEKALQYEIERQISLISDGRDVVQETRLWDDGADRTRSMRSKEEAHDYRYFPDPDLPPVRVSIDEIEQIRRSMPTLPDERVARYRSAWGLPAYDADLLTAERDQADYFEQCVEAVLCDSNDRTSDTQTSESHAPWDVAKSVSNFVMTHVLRTIKDRDSGVAALPVTPARLAGIVRLRLADRISSNAAEEIFDVMMSSSQSAIEVAEEKHLLQVKDSAALLPYVEQVLWEHHEKVDMYLSGKTGLIGFFIGQVMRACPGSPDPKEVRSLLEARIHADDSN